MRYTFKTNDLIEGETREIKKFLWFPKVIKKELRWLEQAIIVQEVKVVDVGGSGTYGDYKNKWRSIEWLN